MPPGGPGLSKHEPALPNFNNEDHLTFCCPPIPIPIPVLSSKSQLGVLSPRRVKGPKDCFPEYGLWVNYQSLRAEHAFATTLFLLNSLHQMVYAHQKRTSLMPVFSTISNPFLYTSCLVMTVIRNISLPSEGTPLGVPVSILYHLLDNVSPLHMEHHQTWCVVHLIRVQRVSPDSFSCVQRERDGGRGREEAFSVSGDIA